VALLVREGTFFFVPDVNCEWPTEHHASDCLNRFDGAQDAYCVKSAHCFARSTASGTHFVGLCHALAKYSAMA
jgi:hypothetical protein